MMYTDETEQTEWKAMEANGFEAIILAGAKDRRLPATDAPAANVLAPVAGKPFLSYVIDFLRMQGVARFVFALGHSSESVERFLKEHYPTLSYALVWEDEPLGSGGAIRLALQKTKTNHVLIAGGDRFFKADIEELFRQHLRQDAACTLALKPATGDRRYDLVVADRDNRIVFFDEKNNAADGLINSRIYVLNKARFFRRSFPPAFSFEEQYLQAYLKDEKFYGVVQDAYYIEIGVPEDYEKAQSELASPPLDLSQINSSWTLFIDRDGVINEETVGEYVLHWGQFIFSKGVLQSFKKLSAVFGRLLLVTNQRGVGKGLMTREALDTIHYEMQREIRVVGGHLDKIYYCTDVDNASLYRKPNPGMAMLARRDFPEIDFTKSIMVGNKPSDMRFGRAAGMYTVFLATTNPDQPFPHPDIDLRFSNLAEFAAALK